MVSRQQRRLDKSRGPDANNDGQRDATYEHLNRRHCFSMTTRQAINAVSEIISENRQNGELEGVLNRYRTAALNRLIGVSELKTRERRKSKPPTRRQLA